MLKVLKRIHNRHSITALSLIVIVAAVSFILAFAAMSFSRYYNLKSAKEKRHSAYEDELRRLSGITVNLAPAPDLTAGWKTYENSKYRFSVKYPEDWQTPRANSPGKGENYLLKLAFDEKGISTGKGVKGFDVYIYSADRFPGPAGTDNLKQKTENLPSETCSRFDDITLGQKGYPAKEVDISLDNPCWQSTFFYSLTKNGYTYNIVPRENKNRTILTSDDELMLAQTYADFYNIVSTLDLAQTGGVAQIPKKIVQKVAPAPAARYTTGRRCPKKKDKPGYSKTKGKHMDEDCCPDPDEWPNPRCAYSASGLGLMRSSPKK